jgi:hypothetical protein
VDSAGDLFIADTGNNVIREVKYGTITTIAGCGTAGYSGDGGRATSAKLSISGGIAVDSAGYLYIADGDRVRQLNVENDFITTVAGTGVYGHSGDGGPAADAEIASVGDVAVDSAGNLFIADTGNAQIREVAVTSATLTVLSTVPGADTIGLFARTTSMFYLRNANTSGFATSAFAYGPANSNLITITGDWIGDGTDTVGLYDPTTSMFFLNDSNASGYASNTFVFGPAKSGMVPIVGDWTGDGKDTIGLYNPATSMFYLKNSNSTGVADTTFTYGAAQSGWTPMVGDWTGGGKDTIGLYNPTSSLFYLRNSNTTGFANTVFAYGPPHAGWIPLIGNWTGSGQAEMAAAQVTAPQNVSTLAQTDLQPIVNEAVALWSQAGLDPAAVQKLRQAQFVISDLPGRYLGESEGNVIYVDTNAAGNGWFIDPTPTSNEEFTPSPNGQQLQAVEPRALDRIDLLTVVEHELGHIAGVGDLNVVSDDLMSGVLGVGVRRDPSHQDAVDAALTS